MTEKTDKKKKCEHEYIKIRTFTNKLGFTVARYECKVCKGTVDAKARPKG